jgi:hypothetical protein
MDRLNLGARFTMSDLISYLRSEIKELHAILHETQLALAQANDRLNRRSEPLTDERIYTLYTRSLDWRQLARDVEADHDI